MENNLRKLLSLLGVVCFSMTQVHADDYSLNSAQDSCAKLKSAVPPGVNCPCDDGPNVWVNAAYTLWTAREEGLAAGYGNTYLPASALGSSAGITYTYTDLPANGKVVYPSWKLRSGFKVGLGAYLDHDCWDVGLEYTWFWNKNNSFSSYTALNSLATTDTGVTSFADVGLIQPLWQPWLSQSTLTTVALATGNLGTGFSKLQTKWDNWFNRIDAELGRAFYVGHYLSFRPFIGLVGAWEEQTYDQQGDSPGSPTTQAVTVYANNQQKWWGVGPYTGFNTAFIFTNDSCNQWSLFLDSGFAIPWGQYKTTNNTTADFAGLTGVAAAKTGVVVENGNNHFWNADPMIELALGLRWETTWSDCNEWSFLLQAAWEEQVWFGHNRMAVYNTGNGGGNNFSLQGLTLKAQLDF